MEYNTDLFYATTIARMLKHFETLLNQIVAKPTAKLTELIELLTAADKQEESWKSKNTKAEYQRKLKTIKRQVVNTANEMEDER